MRLVPPRFALEEHFERFPVPIGITVFPEDFCLAPESWAWRANPDLTYFHEVDKGGHFAAWEQPQLFSEEVRAGFRSLR
jgi:pimeloyl-ACP methyl ester carboxylesterase